HAGDRTLRARRGRQGQQKSERSENRRHSAFPHAASFVGLSSRARPEYPVNGQVALELQPQRSRGHVLSGEGVLSQVLNVPKPATHRARVRASRYEAAYPGASLRTGKSDEKITAIQQFGFECEVGFRALRGPALSPRSTSVGPRPKVQSRNVESKPGARYE